MLELEATMLTAVLVVKTAWPSSPSNPCKGDESLTRRIFYKSLAD